MSGENYYALTALPVLDGPGSPPPLALSEFLAGLPAGRPQRLARTILLGDDLLQREAVQTGELASPDPAVLTLEQLRGEAPLPPELEPAAAADAEAGGAPHALPVDALWEAYYRSAAALARQLGSAFLEQWVATDVRLRNDLARARAEALGLDAGPYLVARSLEASGASVENALNAWLAAPDPLTGLRALLSARWRWIERHEPRFTFDTDEYAAYAAKLALLHRWQRSAAEPAGRNPSGEVVS